MTKFAILVSLFVLILSSCTTEKPPSDRPNIIYILADDLGYGELGCYGQVKIETPNIDALRAGGMKFTRHYAAAPVCAPTRCMLMTGRHSGNAYIRGNDEWGSRGDVWDYIAMLSDPNLEGQLPLADSIQTIAQVLQVSGYHTGIVGKWGLGAPLTESIPTKKGFDYFYGYNCQRQAHTLYPNHLWENENKVILQNDTVPPRTKLTADANPNDPGSYAPFNLKEYAPEKMTNALLEYVDAQSADQPFFMYWASPIPHVPLQAPQKWVDYYINKFGDESPYLGDKGYFPSQHPRATYAAMISYLDENVGKLIALLKEKDLYDNTIIMFSSDNGPSYAGGTDSPWFGSGGPFNSERGYGKGYLYEGGIRVPLIASWPGHIEAGTTSDHMSAMWDIFPTICELAGASLPDNLDGISLLSELTGQGRQTKHDYLYFEFPEYGGQRAIIWEDKKALNLELKKGNTEWMVFDLKNDIREQNNIAPQSSDLVSLADSLFKLNHTTSFNKRWQYDSFD